MFVHTYVCTFFFTVIMSPSLTYLHYSYQCPLPCSRRRKARTILPRAPPPTTASLQTRPPCLPPPCNGWRPLPWWPSAPTARSPVVCLSWFSRRCGNWGRLLDIQWLGRMPTSWTWSIRRRLSSLQDTLIPSCHQRRWALPVYEGREGEF